MNHNILVVVGSPKNKIGNSESIADCLIDKLRKKSQACSKTYLRKEIRKKDNLIEQINNTDIIVLSLPIYENSVPGLVLEFFEFLYENKEKLSDKNRKFLVISNSGFSEPEANLSAINCCRIFAEKVGFIWMGGFGVSPGTLIDGKKLEDAGGTYKKLVKLLSIISEKIDKAEELSEGTFNLVSKPLISPLIYRFAGKMIQNGAAKKLGKEKYYSTPLLNDGPLV